MSNARKKRRIAGLISKGLLDPDWRTRYARTIGRRRRSDPGLGFFAGLWAWIRELIIRQPKPEFRSQRPPKDRRPSWAELKKF